jgi:hypothetical protein
MDGRMEYHEASQSARQGDGGLYAVAGDNMDQYASMGSATNSLLSGMEDGPPLAPSLVDVKRLQKLKADQEQRLKSLCVRVDRLSAQEQRVWVDVARTQERSLLAQEKQWQRQAQEADRLRMERELMIQEQALKERASDMRQRMLEMKDLPRMQKFEENKAASQQVREEARRHARHIHGLRDQELNSKSIQVELRRQQRRQVQLQRELSQSRKEQARQDVNMLRFAELQEEIQNAEMQIAVAEREELSAVSRLQNSQTVRAEVNSQLADIEKRNPSSPRTAYPDGRPDDAPVAAPPSVQRLGRTARSSPRLGASGSSGGGQASAPLSSRGVGMRAGGSRSMTGLGSASPGRTDLSQITEEACAMDSKAAGKKALSGPRQRALQMQRTRQSPTRGYSAGPSRSPGASTRNLQDRGQRPEF